MAFMQPEVTEKQEWAEVETTAGIWWVPFDVLSKSEAESARRGDFEPLLKYTEGNAVYLDQSGIKKGYGVRLSAPGYMDATDWEVYDNKKEALKRAKELVEEGEEGEDHATKKKSPAQLDREIKQALSRKPSRGGGSSPGRQHHSSVSTDEKIRAAIAKFPATFGLRGFPGDVFRISPTASYINDSGRLTLYTQRKDGNQWLDFAKGSESELRREVIS